MGCTLWKDSWFVFWFCTYSSRPDLHCVLSLHVVFHSVFHKIDLSSQQPFRCGQAFILPFFGSGKCCSHGYSYRAPTRDKAHELLGQEQLKNFSGDSSAPAGVQQRAGHAEHPSTAHSGKECPWPLGCPSQMPLPSQKRRTGRCETSSLRQLLLLTRGRGDLGGITSAAKSRKVH